MFTNPAVGVSETRVPMSCMYLRSMSRPALLVVPFRVDGRKSQNLLQRFCMRDGLGTARAGGGFCERELIQWVKEDVSSEGDDVRIIGNA